MKRLGSSFAGLLLVLVPVRGATAGEPPWAALRRALAHVEARPEASALRGQAVEVAGAGPARENLAELLLELERRDKLQRADFEVLARRRLPGKGAERLAMAQEAYARGQGRLLEIVGQLVASGARRPASASVAGAVDVGLVREAEEIAARIEEASRREPLSSGELKVRAPQLRPPALPKAAAASVVPRLQASPPGQDDAPIGSIPKTLKDAAATFGGPIEVYEWVRNNVQAEFYYGSMKGALQTYLERSGNDADTAALLIQLLRAKGVPARFVRGTAELPAAVLGSLTGTSNPEQAVQVLERAGIPHELSLGGGGLSSVKVARVWVEAYVPYSNYRGALLDAQGKAWIALDPAFKSLQPVNGIDVVGELGFDARAVLDTYLSTPDTRTPLEYVRAQVGGLLDQQRPGSSYNDALNHRELMPEALGLLPGSLPYPIVERVDVGYELPDELQHTVRFVAEADGRVVLDAVLPVAELLGRRLTVSYVPFSKEDEDLVRPYGTLSKTPPYLVDVKPVLKSAGVVIASGDGPIGMAVRYTLRMEFKTPGGLEPVVNSVLAGNMLAVGLGGRRITGEEVASEQAAEILSARAWGYLERWNRSDEELARLFRVVPVRPTVSECMVMSDIEVDYAGGDPRYPLNFEWKGIAIDADLRATAPVGLASRASERPFLLISGLEGSVLENKIFEDDLQIASVSTAKALQLAHSQGIEVLDLTQANVDSVLPGLPLDAAVKEEIRAAVDRGLLARVPAANVAYLAWTGVGYLLLDEETGEAAYQLQGGHSGGVTAPAVFDMPAALVYVLGQQDEQPAPANTEVAKVLKFADSDFQFGTVNQSLGRPLRVLVLDDDGHPVPAAPVTFRVVGGEGSLIDPATGRPGGAIANVLSNERGEAEALLVLGQKTGLIPRYYQQDGQEFATRVGMNMVTAESGTAALLEPYFAFGFPDEQFDGTLRHGTLWLRQYEQWWGWANLRLAGLIGLEVTDQFENPLANWPLKVRYAPDPVQYDVGAGWAPVRPASTSPGRLLKAADLEECRKTDPDPKWGKCAGEALEVTQRSSSFGTTFSYALLGNSPNSIYNFAVDGPIKPAIFTVPFSTGGMVCYPAPSCVDYYQYPHPPIVNFGARLIQANRTGDLVEAYRPRETADVSFWADVLVEKDTIEIRTDSEGKEHFYAVGTREWERTPLSNSVFTLTPSTPGTGAGSPGQGDANGKYAASMTMSQVPQLNTLHWESTHVPDRIKYKGGSPPEVEPDAVDRANMVAIKSADPNRPVKGGADFSLWGVNPEVRDVKPSPILLNENEVTPYEVQIRTGIDPPQYATLLDPTDVTLEFRDNERIILAGSGKDTGTPFTILKGLPLKQGGYVAQLRINGVSAGKDLLSDANPVAAGVVKLTLDVNNDAALDNRDDDKFKDSPNATFTFWEADPLLKGLDRLQDYATVRVRLPFTIPADQSLGLTLSGSSWVLKKKVPPVRGCPDGTVGDGREYLCDQETADRQLTSFDDADQPVRRGSDEYEIPARMLGPGANDFLFQCQPQLDVPVSCPAPRMILSQIVDRLNGSIGEVVTGRRVKLRSLREFSAVSTARDIYGPPFSTGTPGSIWDGRDRNYLVARQITDVAGWQPSMPVPDKVKTVNVLVHGYAVTQNEATMLGSPAPAFPTWFKRLYWAGHPVMKAQEAYTIGVTWPGDILGAWYYARLLGVGVRPYYPEDEFSALQTGIPLGDFLGRLRSSLSPPQRINIFAHSLGNMAVNSALQHMPDNNVTVPVTYVMNEAAVASEAFIPNYDPGSGPVSTVLLNHATNLGFSTTRPAFPTILPPFGQSATPGTTDFPWITEEIMLNGVPARWPHGHSGCAILPDRDVIPCLRETELYDTWQKDQPFLSTAIAPRPDYALRWRRSPAMTPWAGFFASNLGKPGVTVVNTYNATDYILQADQGFGTLTQPHAWLLCQYNAKPYSGPLGPAPCVPGVFCFDPREGDDRLDLHDSYWTLLQGTSTARVITELGMRLWGDPNSHASELRRWEELAFWFPAMSTPAGGLALPGVSNIAMQDIGGNVGPGSDGTPSHSYLWIEPFPKVWPGFTRIRDAFKAP